MNRERFWALIQETHPSSGGRAGAQLLARLRELPLGRINTADPDKPLPFDALVEELLASRDACCQHAARLAARLRELPPAEIAAFQDVRDDLLAESSIDGPPPGTSHPTIHGRPCSGRRWSAVRLARTGTSTMPGRCSAVTLGSRRSLARTSMLDSHGLGLMPLVRAQVWSKTHLRLRRSAFRGR